MNLNTQGKQNVAVRQRLWNLTSRAVREEGRPKQLTWKKHVKEEMKKNGLVREDTCNRAKWRGELKSRTFIHNPANSVDEEEPRSKLRL